jgi:hypothetical protein
MNEQHLERMKDTPERFSFAPFGLEDKLVEKNGVVRRMIAQTADEALALAELAEVITAVNLTVAMHIVRTRPSTEADATLWALMPPGTIPVAFISPISNGQDRSHEVHALLAKIINKLSAYIPSGFLENAIWGYDTNGGQLVLVRI